MQPQSHPNDAPRRIPLRRRDGSVRAYALVDAADYERVSRFRWHLLPATGKATGYAVRAVTIGPRKQRAVLMHRSILELPQYGAKQGHGVEVDHINGDGLDNRRANLRRVRRGGNMQNLKNRLASSRFRGVSWNANCRKWRAEVRVDGVTHYLGLFENEVVAAHTAEAFRREYMPYAEPDPELAAAEGV